MVEDLERFYVTLTGAVGTVGLRIGLSFAGIVGHRPVDGDGPSGGDASDDWGGPAWAKTVFIATDKSEAGLREAMLARRFYAVDDNSIRLDFSAAGQPMGSRIALPQGSTVPISAGANHAARVELVTNGGAIAASADGSALTFDAPVTDGETYYFLRAFDAAFVTHAPRRLPPLRKEILEPQVLPSADHACAHAASANCVFRPAPP